MKWSPSIIGCIKHHNTVTFGNIDNIEICQTLCEQTDDTKPCLSVDYDSDTNNCNLNEADTSMVEVTTPCSSGSNMKYSEPIKGEII